MQRTLDAVSPELAAGVGDAIEAGELNGGQLVHDTGWGLGRALRAGSVKAFAAYLSVMHAPDVAELRLGKKAMAAYAEAEKLHGELDRYAYGPPTIRFTEADVDQARAAGVLLELDTAHPIVCDRGVYRELVKQAIVRTRDELVAAKAAKASGAGKRSTPKRERTPREQLDAEHRANLRELTAQAHGVNLDLGAELMQRLAVVDPADMDVARFLALCGRRHRANYADGQLCRRRVAGRPAAL